MWARRECFGIASVVLHRRVSYVEVHRMRLPRTPLQKNCRLHRPCPDAQQDPGFGVPTQENKSRFYFSYRVFFSKVSYRSLFKRSESLQPDPHLRLKQAPGPQLVPEDLKSLFPTSLSQSYSPIGIPAKAPMTLLLVHFLVTPCCRRLGQLQSLLAGESNVQ